MGLLCMITGGGALKRVNRQETTAKQIIKARNTDERQKVPGNRYKYSEPVVAMVIGADRKR